VIDEPACVGCTKCIQACPVDAIVGAAKLMHVVLAAECTGCELCIAPCPVDCIRMETIEPHAADGTATSAWRDELQQRTSLARTRFAARNARLARDRAERDARLASLRAPAHDPVAAALARAAARKSP
jgi:electron transport complex protein RnfB